MARGDEEFGGQGGAAGGAPRGRGRGGRQRWDAGGRQRESPSATVQEWLAAGACVPISVDGQRPSSKGAGRGHHCSHLRLWGGCSRRNK